LQAGRILAMYSVCRMPRPRCTVQRTRRPTETEAHDAFAKASAEGPQSDPFPVHTLVPWSISIKRLEPACKSSSATARESFTGFVMVPICVHIGRQHLMQFVYLNRQHLYPNCSTPYPNAASS
jgi:hypothetical protein